MTLDLEKYTFSDGITDLSASELNVRFYAVIRRIHALELLSIDWSAAVSEVQNYGLARINDAVKPLLDSLSADLAALVAKGKEDLASQSTAVAANLASQSTAVAANLASQSTAVAAKLAEVDSKMTDVETWLTQAEAVIAAAIPKSAIGIAGGVASLASNARGPLTELCDHSSNHQAGGRDALSFAPNGNLILNGNLTLWQRGVTQSTSGYGADDRWKNVHVGSTKVTSRQSFALGNTEAWDAPAAYFSRTVVTSVAGVGNYVRKEQRIEYVQTLAGRTATLSFWAKADASRNMALEFVQCFGTTGSPSADVTGGAQLIALTTAWKRYTIAVDIPSIAGKTLGTDGNDYLAVVFWFDAGTTFSARTANLGQQSGTFDLAQIKLEAGNVRTPFVDRSPQLELDLCQRYYEVILVGARGEGGSGNAYGSAYSFRNNKRASPTCATAGYVENINVTPPISIGYAYTTGIIIWGFVPSAGVAYAYSCYVSADSEL